LMRGARPSSVGSSAMSYADGPDNSIGRTSRTRSAATKARLWSACRSSLRTKRRGHRTTTTVNTGSHFPIFAGVNFPTL